MTKILAIDDNKDNLITLGVIIRDSFQDLVFDTALSGKKGIELAISTHPDVILLDIVMPDMDGFEVCRRLKQDELTHDIPVVFLTAMKEDKEKRIKALEVGGEAFLYKPIDEPELVAQIKAMLKIKKFNYHKRNENERLSQLVAERTQTLEQSQAETLKLLNELKEENEKYRNAEEDLRESELHFRTLANSGQALIWTSGIDKKCNYFNQPWLDFTGRTLEQELSDGWVEGVHPDDLQQCIKTYVTAFDKQEKFCMEYRIRHFSGGYRWILDEGTPRYNSRNEFIGYIGHCLDISERKKAEQEIKQEISRFESLYRINQFSADTIQQFLDFALEEAISLTRSKIGYVFFYDENRREFSLNTWSKEVMQQCNVVDPQTVYELDKTGIWGEAVRQRKPIIVNDFSAPNLLKMGIPEGHAQLHKFLTIPVFNGDQIIAVVGVANKLDDYNDFDILQLNLMMDAVWKSIERKKSEEDILASEARLKRAELASKSGNWELHLDSQTMIASEGAMIVYGLGNSSFKFSEIKKISLPEYRPALDRTLRTLIENDLPYDIEFKIKTADTGEVKDIHSIAIFDKEKRIIFGIIQDITERKRAEEALRDSQLQLSNAVKFAHLGSWEYDVATDLFTFNDSFYSIFRTTAKEVGGYTMSAAQYTKRFVYPEDAPVVGSGNQMAVESNDINFFKQIEHRMLYANGEIGYIKVRFFLIKDENGKTVKTYGVNQDITEQKQTEEILRKSEARLRELNAAKDKFFSIISHDLKSPFNSILGLSNLLVEQIQAKNNEGIEEYASVIQNSSQRAIDLLMNLLEWARSQTGRIEYSPEYVEMIALINEAIELLGDSALQKSITISMELPRTALVFADKAMISTILRNLISNAIKFTRLGGQIVISAEKKKAELIIAIRDNGVGIKKESIDKLFRIDENNSTLGTQNEKGTGLGLILCKEFIEKHGGKIWVESEVGKGSKFYFSVPNLRC